MSAVLSPRGASKHDAMLQQLLDPEWRLDNLYWIVTEDSQEVPFRMNEEQRDLFRNYRHKNLILKARQLGFCLDGNSRVLTADLQWRRIADLRPGDEIVGVDEEAPGGRGSARKMRSAYVQATNVMQAERFRITFDDGRTVICTANHPWLSRKAGSHSSWRSLSGSGNQVTGRLTVGTEVRWVCKPWDEGGHEDGWLGGVIDGEGSLSNANRTGASLCIAQLPGAVWDRMVRYAVNRGYSWRTEDDTTERKTKYGKAPVPKLVFSRMDELFRLIGQTRPTRFIGKKWWDGRDLPGKKTGIGWSAIVSIEPLGIGEVVDLQTSTGTYIAEGFVSHNTTLLTIMALDQCLFVKNFAAALIFHNLQDAEKAFRNKIRFAYERLPDEIKAFCKVKKETSTEMVFENGSSISVGVSARSGTVQWLHVSEFGKICARFPEKAAEVVSGSFNAMPKGALTWVESTAEGQAGYFYDYCMEALRRQQEGRSVTAGEWELHFYAWWKKAAYTLDDERIVIDESSAKYFDKLQREHGISLTVPQKRWYVMKAREQGENMKREFPSYPEEAFEQAILGAIYGNQMAKVRSDGRITDVPYDPAVPVNTFWDLGLNDTTAIWLHQRVATQNRFIGFYQAANEGMAHFVQWLQKKGYVFGTHYLPHDARARMQGERPETREDILKRLLPGHRITVVRRIDDITTGIDLGRQALASCWFDRRECAEGVRMLDNYQYEWDESRGTFRRTPLHNFASNGADSFRQFAQAFIQTPTKDGKKFKRHRVNWRA